MRRYIIVATFILLAIASLSKLPVATAQEQKPRYGGTVVISQRADPQTLIMGYHTMSFASYPASNMFVGLLEYDLDLNPKPNIAESWTMSPDGKTYTFKLLKNVKWHDGKPLTSADYKFSLENMVLKTGVHVAAEFFQSLVRSVEAPDPYTLVVNLNFPFGPFLRLWHPWYMGGALPKHLYEGTDILPNPLNWKPVGNGPFKFVEYVKGSHVRMVRNPDYFKPGLPYADEVILKIIPEVSAQVLGLEKGEISWMPNYFPHAEYERVSKNPEISITTKGSEAYIPMVNLYFNLWDPNRPYVTDVRVRQAIAHAIDKNVLVQRATAGLSKTTPGPFPSVFPWAYDPTEPYPYDVAKANKILDDAGYKKGADGMRFPLRWVFSPYTPDVIIATEVVTQQLKQIGIDVKIVSLEYQTMIETVYSKKDFDMYVHRLGPQFPDPAGYETMWHSKYRRSQAVTVGINPPSYQNAVADDLWDKAAREADQSKRGDLYKQLTKVMQKDLPAVWLWEATSLSAWRKEWLGFPLGPMQGTHPIEAVWWTKGSEVSPTSAAEQIQSAEQQLKQLQSQFYDVGNAMAKLEEAKRALAAREYLKASQLSKEALTLAQPPYWLYGGLAVAVVAAIVIVVIYMRRRKAVSEA